MTWSNLLLWMAQIALLVAAGALLPWVFRLRSAHARLVFWQVLLVACLLLPLLQPWRRSVVAEAPAASPAAAVVAAPAAPGPAAPPWPRFGLMDALAAMLAAGVLARAGWFALGMFRLARLRRAACELDPVPAPVERLRRELAVYPELRVSGEVAGPVTFGYRNPVVLFPPSFPDLEPDVQAAVACHELLHVRRRDWLFTAAEEVVRAVFWFHPAIWWVLGQIQLAREQAVDREAVRLMGARDRYVDALLALSGAGRQADLAPAPLFLRRRHLTPRVAAVLQEVDMSRTRLYVSGAACFAAMLVAGRLVCGALPLQAAPQLAADAPGIAVTAAAPLIHRSPVAYPPEAWAKRIEGVVVVEAQLAGDGTVADASVVSGPMELRSAALESVLKWHFRKEAGTRVQVSVEFRMPADAGPVPPPPPAPPKMGMGVVGGVPGGGAPPVAAGPPLLVKISIEGLSPEAAEDLRARLPVREGQTMDNQAAQGLMMAVREFDRHLNVMFMMVRPGERVLRIMPEEQLQAEVRAHQGATIPPPPNFPPAPDGTQRIRVGALVQAQKLVRSPEPVYPDMALKARISGVVRLSVLIGTDGKMKTISVDSGHPLLVPAAMEAVKQYGYATTLLNGQPVEVVTQVDVNFTVPR